MGLIVPEPVHAAEAAQSLCRILRQSPQRIAMNPGPVLVLLLAIAGAVPAIACAQADPAATTAADAAALHAELAEFKRHRTEAEPWTD